MSIMEYFDIVIKPEPTMQGDLKTVDRREAMKTFAIMGAIIGLIMGLGFATLGGLFSTIGGGAGALVAGLGVLAIIIFPVVLAILSVIGSMISNGIMYLIAKALGGSGTFDQQFYVSSRLAWPVLFATLGVLVLAIIPFVGALISFVWNLYSLYLQVVLISVVHKVSKLKGLIILLIPIILFGIIVVIFAATFLIGLIGAAATVG